MSKKSQADAAWNEEIAEHGLKAVITDRLRFHGGLYLTYAAKLAGCAMTTAKKHLDRLVEEGSASKELHGSDWNYRHIANS